jgi:hypothetical protein
MKKLVFIFIAVSAMVVFGITRGFPEKMKSSDSSLPTQEDGNIKYQVNINMAPNFSFPTCHMQIIVTDETNRLVAPAQTLVQGITTYYFTEKGPVTGTRVAHLRSPLNNIAVCTLFAVPSSATGTFYNNITYQFTLTPLNNNPK